ncbi:MAG TPA: TadE/TadG family type IV pilus assembly protein [Caulobacteraceae bacterium]|nr:TadE/TadG family type IV pilus assembly protein [Caulobacteraceae bacterium]
MRRRGWNEGAAALETALVSPLFIALVLGTLYIGWALYCGAEVRHAVERSTRLVIENPDIDQATLQTAVRDQLKAAEPTDVTVTLTTHTVGTDGEVARLGWTYAYRIDAPFIDPVTIDFDSSIIVPKRT